MSLSRERNRPEFFGICYHRKSETEWHVTNSDRHLSTELWTGFFVMQCHFRLLEFWFIAAASIHLYSCFFALHFGFDLLLCTVTNSASHGSQPLKIVDQNYYGAEKQFRLTKALLAHRSALREEVFVSDHSDDLSNIQLLE